ncbi:MAG: prepilin-type N-terminal cleavage/methylation domain-containing protein [Puniceicoccaceae bacterium]
MVAASKQSELSSQEGFTLVEVIMSLLLMSIVFSAAFGSYFLGMRILEESRQEVRATQIIQSELEAMRTMTWNDIGALNTSTYVTPEGEFIAQYASEFRVYRYIQTINTTQKRVTLWVWWTNTNNQSSYRRFTTIFTKNGLNDYYYREA